MGFIRLLLAFIVVLLHIQVSFSTWFLPGQLVIESFFIISGFFITLVLQEKYKEQKNSYWIFIKNRILRIYPIYWCILFIAIFISFLIPINELKNPLHVMNSRENLLTAISFLVQNATILMSQDPLLIHPISRHFFIPVAWVIKLELLFYCIAPFITRIKKQYIIAIMVISFMTRFMLGASYDQNFNDRFFISQLIFFCMGIGSYWIYNLIKKKNIHTVIPILLYVSTIGFILGYNKLGILLQLSRRGFFEWIYFCFLTLAIPYIFLLVKNNKIDSFLGKLSYPIFLFHLIVILTVDAVHILERSSVWYVPVVFIVTILFSILIVLFIDKPLSSFRNTYS